MTQASNEQRIERAFREVTPIEKAVRRAVRAALATHAMTQPRATRTKAAAPKRNRAA